MHRTNQSSCACGDFLEYLGSVLPPIAPCGLAAMLLVLLSSSNFWWSDGRVLSRLQRQMPSIQRVIGVQRHFFSDTVYTVEYTDGSSENLLLVTDMFQHSYFFRQ